MKTILTHCSLSLKEWDSSILGKPVYALGIASPEGRGGGLERVREELSAALDELRRERRGALVSIRCGSDTLVLTHLLESLGFRFIECYVELTAEVPVNQDGGGPEGMTIGSHQAGEMAELEALAGRSFEYSRYHADPLIERAAANRSRAEWVGNACRGRAKAVLVARTQGAPAGFLVVMEDRVGGRTAGKIDLIAVDRNDRGRGIGKALIGAFFGWCRTAGHEVALVGTQAHNIPSLRLYGAMGFLHYRTSYSLHLHLPA